MIDLSMLPGASTSFTVTSANVTKDSQLTGLPRPTSYASVALPSLGIVAATRVNAGAEVTGVVRDGVAEKAGLRVGDVINAVDRMPVRTAMELAEKLRNRAPGFVGSTRVRVPKRHFHSCRWQEHRRSHLRSQRNGCHPVRQALTSLELECQQLVSYRIGLCVSCDAAISSSRKCRNSSMSCRRDTTAGR
jgi:hypothetical protein